MPGQDNANVMLTPDGTVLLVEPFAGDHRSR
jgi:hypothetical protein